jgi:ribosomal protein S27E
LPAATVVNVGDPRYRCDGCGNLTRFDVTTSRTTKSFHHYTVGGELEVEETTVLSHHVDEVVCRWCGHGRSIVELTDGEAGTAGTASTASTAGDAGALGDAGEARAVGNAGSDGERKESGAQSRTS